jgi:hypothetical protein
MKIVKIKLFANNFWFIANLLPKGFRRLFSATCREVQPFNRKHIDRPFGLIYLCFINLKKQSKMKATKYIQTIILTAIFCVQSVAIFADGTDEKSTANYSEAASVTLTMLAPTTPSEATFEDSASEMVSNFNLAPQVPAIADFEDTVIVITVDNEILAPVTPFEADFE